MTPYIAVWSGFRLLSRPYKAWRAQIIFNYGTNDWHLLMYYVFFIRVSRFGKMKEQKLRDVRALVSSRPVFFFEPIKIKITGIKSLR